MSSAAYGNRTASGDTLLGHVPVHWRVLTLKHLCDVMPSNVDKKCYEGQQAVRLCNYTDVYYNERITRDLAFMDATASGEQVARFGLKAGDVIVTKDSETADDIAVPAKLTTVSASASTTGWK